MIWPWSEIPRLTRERNTAEADVRILRRELDLTTAVLRDQTSRMKEGTEGMKRVVENMQLLMAENEMLRDERKSLRAQLAAKIGMGSAYNPDNPPPSVAATKRVRK